MKERKVKKFLDRLRKETAPDNPGHQGGEVDDDEEKEEILLDNDGFTGVITVS
jgi:hypothetical protein